MRQSQLNFFFQTSGQTEEPVDESAHLHLAQLKNKTNQQEEKSFASLQFGWLLPHSLRKSR